MAIFSTHLLNSVSGTHATNVAITIYKTGINKKKEIFFREKTDESGRLIKEFILSKNDCACTYEMKIESGEYFSNKKNVVSEINVKFKMEDPEKKYHIPIIMSPNGYSIWWSY